MMVLIGYLWMRFVDRAFSHRKLKIQFTWKIFAHALILVVFLLLYKFVLQKFV
ncbi:MAG: hypothetical protein GXP45_07175 [bacterium]|nr:hypothetical protein [bacterium]